MTTIRASELREKDADELRKMLFSSLEEQFKLRMKASSSEQQIQPHLIREIRRNIARIKTVLNEKAQQ
jgi:large subunit ribosomal protein L29